MAVKVITYDVGTTGMKACLFDISAEESVKFIAGEIDGYELLKKTDVMALYDYDFAIGIGDSYTDKNMAKAVDMCFARDVLAAYLDKTGTPYIPYGDFTDVIKGIDKILEEQK